MALLQLFDGSLEIIQSVFTTGVALDTLDNLHKCRTLLQIYTNLLLIYTALLRLYGSTFPALWHLFYSYIELFYILHLPRRHLASMHVEERWGAGVEYHFQEFNEPYAPS